jgi:hypothetical protein
VDQGSREDSEELEERIYTYTQKEKWKAPVVEMEKTTSLVRFLSFFFRFRPLSTDVDEAYGLHPIELGPSVDEPPRITPSPSLPSSRPSFSPSSSEPRRRPSGSAFPFSLCAFRPLHLEISVGHSRGGSDAGDEQLGQGEREEGSERRSCFAGDDQGE